MKERNYYTPAEAAALLHTTREMVCISLLTGAKGWDFKFLMCGNRMKISKDGLDEFVKSKTRRNENEH